MSMENDKNKNSIPDLSNGSQNFVDGTNVYILGDFDSSISTNVIPKITKMIDGLSILADPKINVYINSFGGETNELWGLLSILSIAKSKGIKIITHNIGVAYSCGSMLAVFGDHRVMYKYADNVAHLGYCSYGVTTKLQVERMSDHVKEHFSKIIGLYKEYTKLDKKTLEKILADDQLHINPKTCLEWGFCDEII